MTERLDKRPMFRQTVDTQALIKCLRDIAIGEMITYEELSEVVATDVTEYRGPLDSARRYVMREDRVFFATIRGVGIQRCNSPDVVASLQSNIKCASRAARRGLRKSTCVDETELTDVERLSWLCSQTLLMTQEAIAKPKARKAIEGHVAQQDKVLPYGHVLRALQSK